MIAASPEAAALAAKCLTEGGLTAFPTETVYGLGADATNADAIARLYQAKGRPSFNPLIAHVADLAAARKIARFGADAEKLAAAFWPGPLTLVLPRSPDCTVADLATAGLETIGVRIPSHPVALAILKALGRPVVAPSANRSGHVSPTTAQHVHADLGDQIDLIVDGDATHVGVESTIVGCFARATLLRPGGVPRAEIEAVLGYSLESPQQQGEAGQPLAPGMLASHYAPRAKVRLNATSVAPGEALLAFGAEKIPGMDKAAAILNLSQTSDPVEAAARLFGFLRKLDTTGAARIAVMPIPDDGLGEAINDRLRRAAA
ncbi:MAG: L-threonylcarbamoyladenylate synthase [Xanthobacteraceae bacterium]